ncbi:dihydrolipoamide dehydrogenase [Nanohaloarchaea archaeon SG9]|nr:dihydrolipoamide dehydrogenase [Nanohaloarchaea archaeon SG9]
MKEFDLIVVGSGSGLDVASAFTSRGKDVAVIEPGPLGGTCLNRGCIPSKMLIHHADIAETVRSSENFNIDANINAVDFEGIVHEVNGKVAEDSKNIEKSLKDSDKHTLYRTEGKFVDEKVVEVNEAPASGGEVDEKITAEKILVAAGSRPLVPPIDGLREDVFMTSDEALSLDERPDKLVIIGGGYIAAELAHFFGSLGVEITIVEAQDSLIARADEDISERFTELFSERHDVNLGLKATRVEDLEDKVKVVAEDKKGNKESFAGDRLLLAVGRRPNTDRVDAESGGLELDEDGFLLTDDRLETTVDGVYALGDIAGNFMFKHSANYEAEVVYQNLLTDGTHRVDYTAMPHAVFSSPQISGVGKTEQELEASDQEFVSASYEYGKTGMGLALKEENGFVKVLADPETEEILGCHIMGPEASVLIHEVLVSMREGRGKVDDIKDTIHIHPALNEVVQRAFNRI